VGGFFFRRIYLFMRLVVSHTHISEEKPKVEDNNNNKKNVRGNAANKLTVLTIFKRELQDLAKILAQSDRHYIR
jgi:hypothetical protein